LIGARIAEARGDLSAAVKVLKEGMASSKGNRPGLRAKLAGYLITMKQMDEAGGLLKESLRRFPNSPLILVEAVRYAALRDQPEEAMRLGDRLIETADSSRVYLRPHFITLARMKRDYLDGAAAISVLDRGLELWPRNIPLLFVKSNIAINFGMRELAKSILESEILNHPDISVDQKTRVLKQLSFINGGSYTDGDGRLVVLETTPNTNDVLVQKMSADGQDEMFVHRRPGSERLLLVFTGMAQEAGGIPLPLLHGLLSQLPINVIYLRDYQRLMYLNGIRQIGASYGDTLLALKEIQTTMGANRLFCIGTSAGGYAAIRYGLDMGAEAVLGFGAPTNATTNIQEHDNRGPSILYRLFKQVPEMAVNLRRLVEACPQPPNIRLYYGECMPQDRLHAENMAGLTGIELHPTVDFSEHKIVGKLLADGKLEGIIRSGLDL
jgi:tetratricopeptide (TPR) repeat protein